MKLCKDSQLGIDFTLNSIGSLRDMINQIKSLNSNYNIIMVFKHLSEKYDKERRLKTPNNYNKINNKAFINEKSLSINLEENNNNNTNNENLKEKNKAGKINVLADSPEKNKINDQINRSLSILYTNNFINNKNFLYKDLLNSICLHNNNINNNNFLSSNIINNNNNNLSRNNINSRESYFLNKYNFSSPKNNLNDIVNFNNICHNLSANNYINYNIMITIIIYN